MFNILIHILHSSFIQSDLYKIKKMSASVVQVLRTKSAEVRSQQNPKMFSYEEKKQDITTFFNYMKKDAVNKMEVRAEKGFNSANILEYTYAEYFYIDENNEVVRTPKFVKPSVENGKAYRIFEAIRTTEFKELLDQYQNELGDGMELAMWWPGGNINVIEAIWGPTKYHRKTTYRNKNTTNENIEKSKDENKVTYATIAKSPKKQPINFNDEN